MTGRGRGNGTVTGVSDSAVDIAGGGACASGVGVRLVQTAGAEPALTSAGLPAVLEDCTGVTATGLAPGAAPEATRAVCLGAPTKTSTGSACASGGKAAKENFGLADRRLIGDPPSLLSSSAATSASFSSSVSLAGFLRCAPHISSRRSGGAAAI